MANLPAYSAILSGCAQKEITEAPLPYHLQDKQNQQTRSYCFCISYFTESKKEVLINVLCY